MKLFIKRIFVLWTLVFLAILTSQGFNFNIMGWSANFRGVMVLCFMLILIVSAIEWFGDENSENSKKENNSLNNK